MHRYIVTVLLLVIFGIGVQTHAAVRDPITKVVPQENGFLADFGDVRPGDTLILIVTSPCGIKTGVAAGGNWTGGPSVFTTSIPTAAAAVHEGVFFGEFIPCPGGSGPADTTWNGKAKANVLQFKRTDNTEGDASSLLLHNFMWKNSPNGQLVPNPFSRSQTFTLKYAPGSDDRLDGMWDATYVLESRGDEVVTSNAAPFFLGSTGILYAVAYAIQVDGVEVYSGGAAADSRNGAAGGNVSVTVGGVGISVPVVYAANAAASINFAKDINVVVNKPSAEGAALEHEVGALVVGNSTIVSIGAGGVIGNEGYGTLAWRNSKVLAAHFHP